MILSLIQLLLHKHGKARNQATINEHIQNDKAYHLITTPSGMLINFLAITTSYLGLSWHRIYK